MGSSESLSQLTSQSGLNFIKISSHCKPNFGQISFNGVVLSVEQPVKWLTIMSFMPSFNFGSRSSKTFKPKKNIPEGSHQHDLMKHANATLGSGNLRLAFSYLKAKMWTNGLQSIPWTFSTRLTCYTEL